MTTPIKNTVPISYFFHTAGTAVDGHKIFFSILWLSYKIYSLYIFEFP